MAKKIKAIKCPQCQSVKKEKLSEDLFLCNNCGTEYFLDNDDVNVHINHHNAPQPESFFIKNKSGVIFALVFFVLIIFLLPLLNSSTQQSTSHTITTSKSHSKAPSTIQNIRAMFSAPQTTVENPIVFLVISERDNNTKEETFFVRFYDLLDERAFPRIPLSHTDGKYARIKTFASGKTYLLFRDDENIYEVDFARQEFKTVSDQVLGEVPEFSSGVASVDFTSEDYGFKIFTNNGQEFFYFPEINQLYKSGREVFDAATKNNASAKTQKAFYLFTSKSTDFPDEKIQLIKYWYPDSYPKKLPWRVHWYKEYNLSSGIHVIKIGAPYDKELFYNDNQVKFKDLTPDRLYFKQGFAYKDMDDLYITGKTSANNNAKSYLQRINTETGEVEWNFTLENAKDKFNEFQGYKNGLIVGYQVYSEGRLKEMVKVFDKNGKVLKEMEQDEILKK